ncbi:MAG: aconitate hydratase AcnA [Dehalococcoidia bacterium]|jgi:aconitate hydratase|nr:aconitate hydratase AcnA [Dehalococcoidia bacterium]
MVNGNGPFGARASLQTQSGELTYYRLAALKEQGVVDTDTLPFSIRILLENALRQADGGVAELADVETVASWSSTSTPEKEVPYLPGRVVLQDFTGVPCVVDLASMRDTVAESGGDPSVVNPIIRTDLVIDHSVQVDYFATEGALAMNIEREFERNQERYLLLKWAQEAFDNFRVVPPGAGIVHQVNLEFLSPSVLIDEGPNGRVAYPDTCIGTDSHTTMIDGLGVLGWGVGGIEAEAVMLGQPYYMLVPEVVGVRLTGSLPEGTTATDLVLTVTETLRAHGVVEKLVEFFGPGLVALPVADRATIANMSPEYGATAGFFPVDEQTLRYLRLTNRGSEADIADAYYRAQGLFYGDDTPDPEYTSIVEIDLGSIEPSVAGPRRPQDRVTLSGVEQNFFDAFPEGGRSDDTGMDAPFRNGVTVDVDGAQVEVGDAAVAIAAITSCTNTSNPYVMVGAGLLARNALARGLQRKPWVKTSLAPGSQVVTGYLDALDLTRDLNELGFNTVGYGCTSCIGNSGPLPAPVAQAVDDNDLTVAGVLSGNRNFEGRIHPQVKANYLASPMLVVGYALAGRVDVDLVRDPLGTGSDGNAVYLKDIWPSQSEIAEAVDGGVTPAQFATGYDGVFEGSEPWKALPVPTGVQFAWDPGSTYAQRVPFFDGMPADAPPAADIKGARVLLRLGDSVTTDHISPAGSIPPSAPSGQMLLGDDVPRRDFNTYGARRGNHNVMVRGTFGNIRLRNRMTPEREGDWAIHLPDGEEMRVFDAAMKYEEEGVPLVVLGGREYGTGSSRDWAAKGPALLGVRATIVESYERIHRSNLIGMGVLPLQFLDEDSADSLGLTGRETFEITGIAGDFEPRQTVHVTATTDSGEATEFDATMRIDTGVEWDYYRHGGVLNFVLRRMASEAG